MEPRSSADTTVAAGRRAVDWVLGAILMALAFVAIWSYARGGIVWALIVAAADGERSLDLVRDTIARAGAWGPAVYVAAVVAEVLIAPIPGTLLYAPAGAIFGGWVGGTLSLAGNVIGAVLAAWLAARFRLHMPNLVGRADVARLMERIRRNGLAVVALLRFNPLTSSDLVSYAAGLVGISPWRVGIGTLVGIAPLCYAQAHAAEWLFRWLPGAGLVVLGLGVAYLVIVIWLVARRR